MSGHIRVTNVLLQNAQDGNANGTALLTEFMQTAVLQVTVATFTGTVNFEATEDDTNWVSLNGINLATGGVVNTTTGAGLFRFNVTGLGQIRARTSAVSAGTVTVRGRAINQSASEMPDIEATLTTGDLEIGAVEIKNATDDTRATVGANGLYVDVRASALPTGAATQATIASLLTELQGKADLAETQPVSAASLPLPTGAATSALQGGGLPAALGAGGGLKVDGSGTDLPVSLATAPALVAGTASIGATKDNGPQWTSVFGVSGAAVVSADITTATAVTDAPTAGQKLVITDIVVSTDTAMNILFEEETSGTDIFKVFLPTNGTLQITPRSKVKLATADKKLTAKGSAAGNVGITVSYYSEA